MKVATVEVDKKPRMGRVIRVVFILDWQPFDGGGSWWLVEEVSPFVALDD
jgi:hypothetical protein